MRYPQKNHRVSPNTFGLLEDQLDVLLNQKIVGDVGRHFSIAIRLCSVIISVVEPAAHAQRQESAGRAGEQVGADR